MPYYFERVQHLQFTVLDIDKNSSELIGSATCKLDNIITMKHSKIKLKLWGPFGESGTIKIRAEEVKTSKFSVLTQFRCENLDKKDLFGKSDPYLVISRATPDGSFTPVLRTPHILKTLNPIWDPITQSVQTICNGDFHKVLRIECYDWNKTLKHELIGYLDTTLDELLKSQGKSFDLMRKKKKKSAGRLIVEKCQLIEEPTFLDYIIGGCEMKLMIAIDFTASNGKHTDKDSLHYTGNPGGVNDYVKAIRLVGDILMAYDSTKRIPTFGFGAKLPNGGVSHCFYLNGNPNNPEVDGIDGVLQAYYQTLNNVTLYGPTNFEQIIKLSTEIAKNRSGHGEVQSYCILLILTDGIITDMDKTIDAIVEASNWPLSIVIVGVGNADFTNMDILDADDNPLVSSKGVKVKRDIVQFVPFNKHIHDLQQAVLEELPAQVVSYFKSKNIKPNPPGMGIHQTFIQPPVQVQGQVDRKSVV